LPRRDGEAVDWRGSALIWFVQVKFPAEVPAAAPNGWVTVAVSEDMKTAAREAAFVYRDREHPDDSYPNQLRIRTDTQIRDEDGDAALGAALESLRRFGELTAEAEAPGAASRAN
jgi:hypothetical protein